MKKATYTLFLILTLISVSCSNDDNDAKRKVVTMPVHLVIPATDVTEGTRAGDPGTYEQFKLPTYAYIYIVCEDVESGSNVVVHTKFNLDGKSWSRIRTETGDSVYQYNGDMQVYLPINRGPVGKVYAALSTVELSGLPTTDTDENISETETTVQNYKYDINDSVNAELANIYSTPYNYNGNGSEYYGTMHNLNDLTPSLSIVLYHVAAKLDLKWNVDPSVQDTVTIKSMTVSLPSARSAFIFKPLETKQENAITRDISIGINRGNQWYGRLYSYVLPIINADNNYQFGLTVQTVKGTIRRSPVQSWDYSGETAFTPWIRATINIK